MKIENASYQEDSGFYPFLSVFLDGQPARIHYEQKFLHKDIVFLGSEWEDRVEPIELPADRRRGYGPVKLRGSVRDKRLAKAVLQMRAAVDNGLFATGPVVLPEE